MSCESWGPGECSRSLASCVTQGTRNLEADLCRLQQLTGLPHLACGHGPYAMTFAFNQYAWPPWPNGQGVGLLIRRLRVRVPQGVSCDHTVMQCGSTTNFAHIAMIFGSCIGLPLHTCEMWWPHGPIFWNTAVLNGKSKDPQKCPHQESNLGCRGHNATS